MPLTARFPHFYYAILQLSKFRLTTKGFFFPLVFGARIFSSFFISHLIVQ